MSRPVKPCQLTLLYEVPGKRKWKQKLGMYECACGRTVELIINQVKHGNIKSCGCLHGLRPAGEK
jgi:hypothetical protein